MVCWSSDGVIVVGVCVLIYIFCVSALLVGLFWVVGCVLCVVPICCWCLFRCSCVVWVGRFMLLVFYFGYYVGYGW